MQTCEYPPNHPGYGKLHAAITALDPKPKPRKPSPAAKHLPAPETRPFPELPVVDIRELKHLLHGYYHIHAPNLAALKVPADRTAYLSMQDRIDYLPAKAIALRIKEIDIPSTGRTLTDSLSWLQLHDLLFEMDMMPVSVKGLRLRGWYTHCLRVWVGRYTPDMLNQVQQLAGSDLAECPDMTEEHRLEAIKELIRRVSPHLLYL